MTEMKNDMETKLSVYRTNRTNIQFSLLSAIGAVLVVSGHCYIGGISLAYEWFPIYSFQLSLFVFISGYFYKPEYERNAFHYILKRFKRLVIPAYLWNIVYGLFILLMKSADYSIGAAVDPFNLFVMPFVDGEAFQYNLGSWFVYPLFVVCAFNVLFRKLTSFAKIHNDYLILVLYLIIGVLGVRHAVEGRSTGVMKLLTRAMFFLPFYQFGVLYRARWERKDRLNSTAYFAVLFTVQLLILTFYQELQYYPSAMSGFDNGTVLPYVTSLTGIAFWLRISRLLAPTVGSSRIIRLISENTYSIMIHQMMGFMCVKWLFYLISLITGLFPDFSRQLMTQSIWYYYLPNGRQQYGMLYMAAGIILPIAIKTVGDKLFCYGKKLVIGALHGRVQNT